MAIILRKRITKMMPDTSFDDGLPSNANPVRVPDSDLISPKEALEILERDIKRDEDTINKFFYYGKEGVFSKSI